MGQQRSLVSPLVVGRDDVLAIADRHIAEAKAGRGSLLLFAGEAGIGKTRLVLATIRKATAAGFRVGKGDLAPQDALVSLASVHDLARSLPVEQFGSLGPDLLAIEGGRGGDNLASRRILVRDIADRVISAISVPTLLAFADVQWADELALEVIGELARLGRDRPLLLLADYRLEELPVGSIHRDWRSRLLTQRLAEECQLKRLTRDETGLVTTLILGTGLPASREVVDAVYQRTNGIPLHIEELLAAVGTAAVISGRAIQRAAVPDTIEDTVLARAGRLSPEAQTVARAGAVMGRCFAPSALAGLIDRTPGDLEDPLAELVRHGFLYPFEVVDEGYFDFRHQLLRDAIYQSVPGPELRRLHARAAEFGTKLLGANEIHTSLHFERAGMREQAFRSALAGARAAASITSRYESFELYRRAIANVPDGLPAAELALVYEEYCGAAYAVDDVEAIEQSAREARRLYLEAGDALGAAGAIVMLVGNARRDIRPRSERKALMQEAEAAFDAVPPTPGRAAWLAELRFHRAMLAVDVGQITEAIAMFKEAGDLLREAGEEDIDAEWMLEMARTVGGQVERLPVMLDLARRARDRNLESAGVTAYRTAGAVAVRLMDYGQAEIGVREGLRYADEVQQSYCRHVMAATSAHLAWAAGRWDEALEIGGIELVERGSRRGTIGSRHALGFVAFGRGDVEAARDVLDGALAVAAPTEEPELVLPTLWGLAETELVAGRPAAASAYCLEGARVAEWTAERPLLVPFVVTGVRAALAERRPEGADDWLARMRTLLSDWPDLARPALEHAEGLVRHAAGSTVVARSLLESALAGWESKGRIWEATQARLDLAACMIRGNRPAGAFPILMELRATARRLASPALLARVDELERSARGHGGEQEAWHPLTIREYEVARQIASGMTNNEIAAALSLSPKTVSAHVEHILAKLDVARRAEIAAWVSKVALPTAPVQRGRDKAVATVP
jgi:DNA-binding CsgD family transcriptional regulator